MAQFEDPERVIQRLLVLAEAGTTWVTLDAVRRCRSPLPRIPIRRSKREEGVLLGQLRDLRRLQQLERLRFGPLGIRLVVCTGSLLETLVQRGMGALVCTRSQQPAIPFATGSLALYRLDPAAGNVEFLLGRWHQNSYFGYLGGHVEPGVDATVMDAAVREFNEETYFLFEEAAARVRPALGLDRSVILAENHTGVHAIFMVSLQEFCQGSKQLQAELEAPQFRSRANLDRYTRSTVDSFNKHLLYDEMEEFAWICVDGPGSQLVQQHPRYSGGFRQTPVPGSGQQQQVALYLALELERWLRGRRLIDILAPPMTPAVL